MLSRRTREPQQLILRSIQDLDQRRFCQKILVRSVLEPQRVLLKTGLDPQEPGLTQDLDHENWKSQRDENVLQLKERLTRDAGLLSQIQDLDRQILELRLDVEWLQAPPSRLSLCDSSSESPAPDSRSSSGFFDLSDGPSLSDSVFSLCSALDLETTPPSPVTPPPTAQATPPATDVSRLQTLLQHSLSSSSPLLGSSAPLSSSSSSAPLLSSSSSSSSSSAPLSPLSHLDRYISSLLQRRAQSLRPTQPRTTKRLLLQPGLSCRPSNCAAEADPDRVNAAHNEFELRQTSPKSAELGENRDSSEEKFKREKREAERLKSHKHEIGRRKASGNKHKPTLKSRGLNVEEDLRFKCKNVPSCREEMDQRTDKTKSRKSQRRRLKSGLSLITTNEELLPLETKQKMKVLHVGETRSRAEGSELRQKKRRRRRRSGAEEQQDRASLRSCSVKSWSRSLVKHRTRLGQSQQSGRAAMSQARPIRAEEEGAAEEGTGSEHAGRGGAKREQLVRMKASQSLKKKIQRLKSGTFTLMTTV